jgi:hypothetical protein
MGHDNECLNYFLPIEEVLASTWEFLSGAEQDLWDDDEEEEDNSWHSYESVDDWDAASYLNEYPTGEHAREASPPFLPTDGIRNISLEADPLNAA